MNCSTARKWIQLDLDGELSARRCRTLEKHLIACRRCREIQQQFSVIQQAMKQIADASMPETGERNSVVFAARPTTSWRGPLAAAAVLALLVGSWMVAHDLRTSSLEEPMLVQNQPAAIIPAATPATPDPKSCVQVTFDPNSDVIAVPIETDSPNVTIYLVYPAVKMAQAPDEPEAKTPPSQRSPYHEQEMVLETIGNVDFMSASNADSGLLAG